MTSHSCPKFKSRYVQKPLTINSKQESKTCGFCEAKIALSEEVACSKCCVDHCLKHRHEKDHECPQLMEEVLQNQYKKRIKYEKPVPTVTGSKGAKNESLAKKVAYMKLKSSAQGLKSVPMTERIYLRIVTHDSLEKYDGVYYFSKEWSMGRCVDFMCDHYFKKIKNDNNKNGSSGKMCFVKVDSDDVVPLDMFLKDAMLQNQISDGDTLILKRCIV